MSYSPDMYSTALRVLVALVIVMGGIGVACFFIKRLLRKDAGRPSGEKLIRVVANSYIGVKKSISLVEIPGAVLVLGVTGDNVRLLTKIEDERIINQIMEVKRENMPPTFSNLLHKLSSRFTTDKDENGVVR